MVQAEGALQGTYITGIQISLAQSKWLGQLTFIRWETVMLIQGGEVGIVEQRYSLPDVPTCGSSLIHLPSALADTPSSTAGLGSAFKVGVLLKQKQGRFREGDGVEVTCSYLHSPCSARSSSTNQGEILITTPARFTCQRQPPATTQGISFLKIKRSWQGVCGQI